MYSFNTFNTPFSCQTCVPTSSKWSLLGGTHENCAAPKAGGQLGTAVGSVLGQGGVYDGFWAFGSDISPKTPRMMMEDEDAGHSITAPRLLVVEDDTRLRSSLIPFLRSD